MKNKWVIVQDKDIVNLPDLNQKVLCEFFKEFHGTQERIRAYAVLCESKGRKSRFYLPLFGIYVPAYKVFRFSIVKDSSDGVVDGKEEAA